MMAEPNLIDTATYLNNLASAQMTSVETQNYNIMAILRMTIACFGIVSNTTVVVVFLNHQRLRKKIPNIYIINQVSEII